MNKLYLSNNLAFLGSLALGMIAATGIVTAPAKAATILGELEWDDGTSNFFEDVNPGTGDTFDVFFSPGGDPPAVEGLAESFDTTGIFVPPLQFADPGNPQLLTVTPPAEGNFIYSTNQSGAGSGSFVYELVNDLVFVLEDEDAPAGAVTVTYGAGERFLGSFDTVGGQPVGVGFEEIGEIAATVTIPGEGTFTSPNVIEELVFTDLEGGNFGSYGAEVQIRSAHVPEPASILGLLAFGGLSLGLKHKKQS